jgi:hypothetical protein
MTVVDSRTAWKKVRRAYPKRQGKTIAACIKTPKRMSERTNLQANGMDAGRGNPWTGETYGNSSHAKKLTGKSLYGQSEASYGPRVNTLNEHRHTNQQAALDARLAKTATVTVTRKAN